MMRKLINIAFVLALLVMLFACNSKATDILVDVDANEYGTVKIGDQTWMTQDLRATHYADGEALTILDKRQEWSQLKEDDAAVSFNDNRGRTAYYTFAAATRGDVSGNNVQGICPDGWHVPSNNDWRILVSYLADNGYNFDQSIGGGPEKVAKALASKVGWEDSDRYGHIGFEPENNNTSGFSAAPIGYREVTGLFYPQGTYAYWWSSSIDNDGAAYARLMGFIFAQFGVNTYNKSYGFAVRCVKDE